MLQLLFAALLIVRISAQDPNQALVNCEPGTSWVANNIRFECLAEPGSSGFKAIGCITDDGQSLNDGESANGEHFKYACNKEDELSFSLKIISCISPAGVNVEIGSQVNEDHGYYVCIRDIESLTVQLVFVTELSCTYNGQTYAKVERFTVGTSVFQCDFYRQQLQIVPFGCVLSDGRELRPFNTAQDDGQGVICIAQYGDEPSTQLEPVPKVCVDQEGRTRELTEIWVYDEVEYFCDLKRGEGSNIKNPMPEIKPRACLAQIPYSNGVQTLKVFINQAKKARDKKFYWCQPQDANPEAERPFDLVEIPPEQARCENGKKLNSQWFDNNVLHKCKWSKDGSKAIIVDLACASDDMKFRVMKGEIRVKSVGEAYICEILPGDVPHRLNYRRLTPDEYYEWDRNGDIIDTTSGSFGRGIKLIDEFGDPVCADGYEWKEERCQDVNECEDLTSTCGTQERCKNSEGAFSCFCIYGYARNLETGNCGDVECGC